VSVDPCPLSQTLSPNPLSFFRLEIRAPARLSGPFCGLGGGVWGEGRDLRSLALLPEKSCLSLAELRTKPGINQ
jgi:hypothetical protein